jgi:predicted peptidase
MRRRVVLPAILVTPLCPGARGWRPEMLVALVDELRDRYRVDPDRVYLAGMSMGGFGTWETVSRYPERFAAAVSLCGGGNPSEVGAMAGVPIWNIHGAKDDIVPLDASEECVKALRAAGGYVIHTVEPEMDHMDLIPWHTDARVYEWLLGQRRGVRPDEADIPRRDAMRLPGRMPAATLRETCPPVELRTFSRPFADTYDGQYLLYRPEGMDGALPLLVFLHGSGERGSDLDMLKRYGPMKLVHEGRDIPMLVAAPQCPKDAWGWKPEMVAAVVDDVCARYPVDGSRVYLMGLSMGGSGAWRVLSFFPDRFAAMVAVAGVDMPIDPYGMRDVPSRTYLGADDEIVDEEWAARMVARVADAGGSARCIVVPDAKHLDMTKYTEDPAVFGWLLEQRRGFVATPGMEATSETGASNTAPARP